MLNMSAKEKFEFKYVNNSVTTQAQHRLISKLAKYFRVPVKTMRTGLDVEYLKDTGLIRFSFENNPSLADFYVASFPVSTSDLIDPQRLADSKFLSEYALMISTEASQNALFVVCDRELFVLCKINDLNFDKAWGGIVLADGTGMKKQILLPLDTYLKLKHPVTID